MKEDQSCCTHSATDLESLRLYEKPEYITQLFSFRYCCKKPRFSKYSLEVDTSSTLALVSTPLAGRVERLPKQVPERISIWPHVLVL